MYDPSKIEPKWQAYWLRHKTFKSEVDTKKPKYYVLDMFPYPSGAGLHVGHPEGYTATDIISRYKRMKGFNVLHPMGWDAFGLPAENYAIKTGRHPREVTAENVATFKKQIQSIGFSYDWDREVDTTDPNYYHWTQWIFLQIYNKGLAYMAELPINWCPSCLTGLANEEVVDGKCDRCGTQTTKKMLRQWVLKITAYADRLIEDLEGLDWPAPIKAMQENWIGKSFGCNVVFDVDGHKDKSISVFTTRVDTLYSGAFVVLAPEHKLVHQITTDKQRPEIEKYIEKALMKSDLERTDLAKEKTGAFTGAYAINPIDGSKLPIWIGDFVLAGYGTGAVFGDAHDERDFEFAKKQSIPLKVSIRPADDELWHEVKGFKKCFTEDGTLVNSGEFDGLTSAEAREKITAHLTKMGKGEKTVNYKMKDWVFSRQRYWGEPIPVVHCEKCGVVPVPEKDLPVLLPDVEKYQPTGTGESPLAAIDEWVNTKCPKCKGPAKRETNTMPQWGGSCWYYLRYLSPWDKKRFADPKEQDYWMNVDLYVGGAEHAVLHLLYARFWHKVLFDLGHVKDKEPFHKLMNQGLILGEDGEKMSKSRGNVVNPDDVIKGYGADTLRLYEMFMGPFDAVKPWSTKNIEGCFRFLQKVWRIYEEQGITEEAPSKDLERLMHKTIKKVGEDIENFRFNTAISAMMIFANDLQHEKKAPRACMEALALLVAPFAPHLAEEIWEGLGHKKTLAYQEWPAFDPAMTVDNEIEIVFCVNGKRRGSKVMPKDVAEADAIAAALADADVQRHTEGKEILKKIYVPGRQVNVVVK
jgi:leucyl-tRNA synthetase